MMNERRKSAAIDDKEKLKKEENKYSYSSSPSAFTFASDTATT